MISTGEQVDTAAQQAAEIRQRREEELAALYAKHGLHSQLDELHRQERLALAGKHYERILDLETLCRRLVASGPKYDEYCGHFTCCEDREMRRVDWVAWRWFRRSSEVVSINDVDRLDAPIPYGIMLSLDEATALGCFDRFAVLAPLSQFRPGYRTKDPVLLGVVESSPRRTHTRQLFAATYFYIAEWE